MVNLNFVVIAGEILVLHTKFNPMKKKVLVPAAPIVMNAVSFLHPPIDNFMLTTRSCSPLSILPRDCLNLFATIQVKSSKSVLGREWVQWESYYALYDSTVILTLTTTKMEKRLKKQTNLPNLPRKKGVDWIFDVRSLVLNRSLF